MGKRYRQIFLVLILLGVVGGFLFFWQGKGMIIGKRENQTNIDLEVGLWTSGTVVEQTFMASMDNLCRIDFYIDSYYPWDSPYLECRLFEIQTDENPANLTYQFIQVHRDEVRFKRLNGWTLSGHMFNSFSFPPIPQSEGKRYLFSIQSPGLKKGGSSILLASPEDRYQYYGNLFINEEKKDGDLAFRVLYQKPRNWLIQKSIARLVLEKPSIFSSPLAFYLLFLLYLGLLWMLAYSLLGAKHQRRREEDIV